MDSFLMQLAIIGFLLIIVLAIIGVSCSIKVQRNRKWTKEKARKMSEQDVIEVYQEKDYWKVLDNLTIMKEDDSEADYLLDKLKVLKVWKSL